jgi:histidyl-tRNA synthetase
VQGIEFTADHTLVRGMDLLHAHHVRISSSLLGAQSGVGGGGRYDDLVSAIGGPPTPVWASAPVGADLLALSRSGADLPESRPPARLSGGANG